MDTIKRFSANEAVKHATGVMNDHVTDPSGGAISDDLRKLSPTLRNEIAWLIISALEGSLIDVQ